MIEAAKTTASAGEIWLIVVVAVACLLFWLSMVAWADRHPIWRGQNLPEMPGPVLGGMHVGGGRSVAPNRDAPPVLTDIDEETYAQADFETQPAHPLAAEAQTQVPAQRPAQQQPATQQVPAQPGAAQAASVPEMPTQRTGDADQAERTATGPADQGSEEA